MLNKPLLAPFLAVLIMIGTACSACWADYFQDDFGSYSGWTYTTASTGSFSANGALYLSSGGDTGGGTQATKPLATGLNASSDFLFTVTMRSGPDVSATCGTFAARLLDASNSIVAEISWHDVQAATGYGGLDFLAQYGIANAIYRTDPSGFGTLYPVFPATGDYGTLSLKRVGSNWSAWVNGSQVGSTLILAPTLSATAVEVDMGHWQLWGERNLMVDDITVTTEPAATVPAPVSVVSGAIGLACLGGYFRKRRK